MWPMEVTTGTESGGAVEVSTPLTLTVMSAPGQLQAGSVQLTGDEALDVAAHLVYVCVVGTDAGPKLSTAIERVTERVLAMPS
jgi:hypothetical protein